MLSLVASVAMLAAQDQPPRLRTVLDNGAIVLVEPMPQERVVSVQLFASARYVPETEATHGFRHLIEHLLAVGDGGLDKRLETQACFLRASTLRDAMQIELTVGPTQLQLALDTLAGFLHRPTFTQAQIDKELRVMRDELAMRDDSLLLASAAWDAAYGDRGLDPLGTFDSMYRATPEKLEETYDRQFAPEGLVIAIAGPVDMDKATAMASRILVPLSKSHFSVAQGDRVGKPGRSQADAFGECRGAIVPGFDTPQTAAALSAALAIGSELPGCFVIYTPTTQNGLVLVGRTDSTSGLGFYVDGLANGNSLYRRGQSLAREWVQRQLRTASADADIRGLLLCQGAANRPELMIDQINAMSKEEFNAGIEAFKSGKTVIAVGTR
ncbi:MAG TPA: insulinase family protein [Fimbriimonadaceae bacterium]|nr:insulinase family protein [Fimbriimonadaceae bacterium]